MTNSVKPTSRKSRRPRIREEETVRFSEREREFAFSVAMKYVKDEDEAADVAQEALLLAYRHRASFRGDSRFTTWLYRVAATTALMHLRKKRRQPTDLLSVGEGDGSSALEVAAAQSSPEEQMAAHEAVDRAKARLARMGEKYGEVFLLRFRDGYSESEIAKKLALNVATVKTRAYRARAAVREELLALAG